MVVDFIFNTVGLKSNFTNLSYEVPDEYTYSWDFGDEETSTELNPTHEYQKMGFYRVSMSIVDSNNRPVEKVTKEQRGEAKAVNFGIVYGISDYGLAQQLGITNKKAKEYIKQYLEKYNGVKSFMDNIVEKAKEEGYVETLFHRRRYIPELKSNNYMIRQFGSRAAMNTPIQGTAADIMKIAMINVFKKLQEEKLEAKLVLQIHDELIIECNEDIKQKVKEILQDCMENAAKLSVPLKVETSEANSWYDVK